MHGGSTPISWTRWDSSWPSLLEPEAREALEAYFKERFGVETQALERFSMWKRSDTIYALSICQEDSEPAAGLQVVSAGLPFARRVGKYLKPTSSALRLLQAWITKNRLRLKPQQAVELLGKGQLSLEHSLEEGYVLVESAGVVLGCALALPGRLKSQIPKSGLSRASSLTRIIHFS